MFSCAEYEAFVAHLQRCPTCHAARPAYCDEAVRLRGALRAQRAALWRPRLPAFRSGRPRSIVS